MRGGGGTCEERSGLRVGNISFERCGFSAGLPQIVGKAARGVADAASPCSLLQVSVPGGFAMCVCLSPALKENVLMVRSYF